ncbi:MAG: helix-turn-helix domain-containing protein [Bacteroidales bacterium]|nr:helix-turn-helix domain-containing protein [Bacteroidales bacterium]
MMPLMDGCELCNRIKGTMEYSHIPVILLTAAVGMETRIETLEVGADGYIEKPFPIDLLMANIASLFKNREISYNQFANSPLSHYNSVTASKVDEEFMDKLHSTVMTHMAEQDLSIESLTSMMNTSKSTLYRKVKANTGLNINEYIRLCRLKQAAEMLSSQKYKVNEVGYLVGFSSPSYFATCFQKQFNISPSAFVKKIKE